MEVTMAGGPLKATPAVFKVFVIHVSFIQKVNQHEKQEIIHVL